jgi:Flp pilus assembly protein TadG
MSAMTWLRRRLSGDEGIVAIWTAMLAVVLFGMAAFAVDIARWYVEGERLQKSVDAAALAGAVYLPGDGSTADANALALAEKNGWTVDGNLVTFVPGRGARPSQMRVTMSSQVSNAFAGLLGFPTTTVTRTAVAEYAGPVPMGSPCNVFGREDMERTLTSGSQGTVGSAACSSAGSYWANIAGSNVNKARGDGYAASWCTKPDDGVGIDRCDRVDPTGANPGRNLDYTADGYVYIARVKKSGTLDLQGYDIGWAATGDNCTQGNLVGVANTNAFTTTAAEARARYASGASSPFCTGDTQMDLPEGDASAVRTVVTVRKPSPSLWNPLAGEVACRLDLPGWSLSTPRTALSAGDANSRLLQQMYHRWMNLCPTPLYAQAGDDWSIQIQTVGGGGQNRFSLRANMSAGASGADVSIFGAGKISLFNNVPAGSSTFNVLRLDSSTAGRVLSLQLFDIGDATAPVTVQLLQPDSNSPFASCTGIGPFNGALSNCSVTTTAARNGGRWQTIQAPIPANYACSDDRDQAKCWVKVRLTTSSGQADTTTWSASLSGDPLRIVE